MYFALMTSDEKVEDLDRERDLDRRFRFDGEGETDREGERRLCPARLAVTLFRESLLFCLSFDR